MVTLGGQEHVTVQCREYFQPVKDKEKFREIDE
jgi:hypothetical protein